MSNKPSRGPPTTQPIDTVIPLDAETLADDAHPVAALHLDSISLGGLYGFAGEDDFKTQAREHGQEQSMPI